MAAPSLEFAVRAPGEASAVAHALAANCAEPERIAMALAELIVNAVEHGNLGIGNRLKTRLLLAGTRDTEIARRLALPEYAGRIVRVTRRGAPGAWIFDIEDDGEGFDWRPFLDADAARAAAPNGRGIALARRLAFPDLLYLGKGNHVRCSAPAA